MNIIKAILIRSLFFLAISTACSPKENFPQPQSFFLLVNKSQSEMEMIYGKPVSSKRIEYSGNYVYTYQLSDDLLMNVEYFKGKANSFDINIPYQLQTKRPEEALKLCALDLQVSNAESDIHALSWHNDSDYQFKTIIRINKVGEEYSNCEAHFFPK